MLDKSYESVLMYALATPAYKSEKAKDKPKFDESLDANNPNNFKDIQIDDE